VSFWERLLGKNGGPLGGMWAAAQNTRTAVEARDFVGILKGFGDAAVAATPVGMASSSFGRNPTLEDLSVPYRYGVARPIATYNNVAGQAYDPRQPENTDLTRYADPDIWRKAWNESANVSPGQSELLIGKAAPENLTFATDEKSQAERDAYFRDTWAGKYTSGTIDLMLNLTADPVYLGAKVGKAAELGAITLKTGERGAVVTSLRDAGEIASRKVQAKADRIDGFLKFTDNATAAEIALHPALAQTPERGTIAYLLERANKSFPGDTAAASEARRSTKLDLIGSLLGDSQSVARLNARSDSLVEELARLSTPPQQTRYVEELSFDDMGQGSFLRLNSEKVVPEVERQRTAISAEIARLDRAIGAAGTVTRVGGTRLETARFTKEVAGLRTSVIPGGVGERPIVVMGGQLGTRLTGHVSLRDPVEGFDQLNATLKQASTITGAQRSELLNRWVRAASDGDRQGVVRAAERAIVRSMAERYNLPVEQADAIIRAGEGTRKAVLGTMRTRLYSAIDQGTDDVSLIDPEWDLVVTRSRPVAQSQIEDFHPIIDPRRLERLFRTGTHNRLYENLGAVIAGDAGQTVGTRLYQATDPLAEITLSALNGFTKLWKDATLLPRGVAYGIRVQTDTQARLMTHMGMLNYFASAPRALKAQALMTKEGRIFGSPDIEKAVMPMLKDAGLSPEEAGTVLRMVQSRNGGMADLANEAAGVMHQKFVATGSWGRVARNDPLWQKSYEQAVLQIRNSPTMQRVLLGDDDEALRLFLSRNPEGRKEWLELRGSYNDDQEEWLSTLRAHIDHYLPDATTKDFALKEGRGVSSDDVRAYFDGQPGLERRMEIHGESHSPVVRRPVVERYNKSREHLYKLVADAPETVLGRVPLYVYEYKANLRRILNNLTQDGAVVDTRAIARARTQADRIARRNVGKILFDSSHTSNLAHTYRFVSPFFAAWEDMMKKWGGLFYAHPEVAVRFKQAWDVPRDAGLAQDEYGNEIRSDGGHYLKLKDGTFRKLDPMKDAALIGDRQMVVVPLSFIPKKLRDRVGGVKDLKFDQRSFNVIFQGDPPWLPGTGPLVGLTTNQLVRTAFPEHESNPVIEYLLPFGTNNDPAVDQLLPAWARNLKKSSILGTQDDYRTQMANFYKQEMIRYRNGERGSEPTLGEVANKSRNWFLMRTFTSLTSPLSVQPTMELQFYIDQAHIYKQQFAEVQNTPEYRSLLAQYTEDYGDKGKDVLILEHPEYMSAEARFEKDFPEYFDLYVSVSTNETGLVANIATVQNMKKFPKEIAAAPEFAWAIVGPDNAYGLDPAHAFSQAAYNYQQVTSTSPGSKQKFREVQDPRAAYQNAEAQRGWIRYQKARTLLNLKMEELGIDSLRSKGAEGLKVAWDAYVAALGAENQSWQREFGQRDESRAVDFLRTMKKNVDGNKALAERPDMAALNKYISARSQVMALLKARGGTLAAAKNQPIAEVWESYIRLLISQSPGFEQLWNRALEQDKLTVEVG
jgi:hypothetical protein